MLHLKPVIATAGAVIGAVATVITLDSTGWMKVWDDVWGIVGPVIGVGLGGFIAWYLKKLNAGQATVVQAASETVKAATVVEATAKQVAARHDNHLDAQDQVLGEIHVAVNGHKAALERQNAGLILTLRKAGLEVPTELMAPSKET